ncbi:MAG: sugar phosphate nucleotidyltransferase [Candidatus Spyradenecus sp.]
MLTTTAFILCAGLGTRLRPMTLATPKPLLPLWNRPLLAHTLATLEAWGVREVYLNTHWLPEALRAFIAAYRGPLTLHELPEPEILGTGGCLRNLAAHLHGQPFWLVNGDILFTVQPAALEEAFARSGNFAAAWLEPKRGPRTVEMDYAGRITCYHSPTPAVEHTYTFTGISLLSPEMLDFLPQEKAACTLIEAFEAAMFKGRFVQGAVDKAAYWNDAGTLERYLAAHRDARKLPALAAYCAGVEDDPAPEVAAALAKLRWDARETIVIPLGARGSRRTFWRLVGPKRSAIAIAYETEGRPENGRYAACAAALAKAGVAVPRVLADEPGLLLLEDLGDTTLTPELVRAQAEAERRAEAIEALFPHDHAHEHGEGCSCHEHAHDHAHGHAPSPLVQAMELLARFHAADVGDLPLEPPFDGALYDWERGLYEQFVGPLPEAARREWEQVKATLLAEPAVLVHRDFQSTNLLLHKQKVYAIDFQGMRRGAALYDLASFLYDPYVTWSPEQQAEAIAAYAHAAGQAPAALQARLPFAGVQRLMQAIGAYHRLASVGQPRFLAFVPAARERAAACAQAAGLPALAEALRS